MTYSSEKYNSSGSASFKNFSFAANTTTGLSVTQDPITNHADSLSTIDPTNSYSSISATSVYPVSSSISSTTDVAFTYQFNQTGNWYTFAVILKRIVKQIASVFKNVFRGAGYWINQFAVIAFIRSRPRILLN